MIGALLMGLVACGKPSADMSASADDAVRPACGDTAEVALALLPTMDCLPYYYAAERGYFAREGVVVKVYSYPSQWAVDTAIIGTPGAVGVTDVERVAHYRQQGVALDTIGTPWHRDYALVVCGTLRLRKVADLRRRTVGASRQSAVDVWCRKVMKEAGIADDDILRPQINSVALRTSMLHQNQLDAALLPEPYITIAKGHGHKVLWRTPAEPALTCLARKQQRGAAAAREMAALQRAYRRAVDSLNVGGKAAASELLRTTYGLSAAEVDSLPWTLYKK